MAQRGELQQGLGDRKVAVMVGSEAGKTTDPAGLS